MAAEQDKLRRIAKHMKDACEREHFMERQKESRQRDKENRGAESGKRSNHLGEKGDQEKKERGHQPRISGIGNAAATALNRNLVFR